MQFKRHRGFTLLELQVAIVLLAFGVVTLASLLATQTRMLKRLERGFANGAVVHVTQSNDPWVLKLRTAARLSSDALVQPSPPTVTVSNTVELVNSEAELKSETVVVTADATPID